MLRVASLVAFLTVLSKVLGLARDLVIANYFGTSILSDAFNMAYLFTGNFFIIFGCIGGPFYSAMVASLPKLQSDKVKFLEQVILKTTMALLLLAGAIFLVKPWLLSLFIDKAQQPEYFDLTSFHINILLPLVVLCGPIGIIAAILNTYKKYIEPSLSPAVINVVLIGAVFFMGDAYNGLALSLGTSVGAVLAFLFQGPSLLAVRKSLGQAAADLTDKLKQDFSDYHHILFPALLATAMSQAMVFVDSFFCKGLEEGSWTALVMANRLIQMPLGVLLTSFLVPVFPRISELAAQSEFAAIGKQIRKALTYIVALALPAVIVGTVWTEPLIRLVFERGAFDARSTELVSSVFFYLSISIIPYIFRDTITRVFYSLGDSRTPMYVAILAIALKLVLNYYLVAAYGLSGIAMATVSITLINFLLLLALFPSRLAKLKKK